MSKLYMRRRKNAERLVLAVTPARRLVFDEILKGGASDEIAERIGIARATVRVHTVATLAHFGPLLEARAARAIRRRSGTGRTRG